MTVISHAKTPDSHQTGVPGCCRTLLPFDKLTLLLHLCPPKRVDARKSRQFWLSRESSLSYASLPSPEFSMRLLPIRVALKTFSLEEWFWRLVFVGVVCDFLYLGWFIVRSLRAH